MLHCEYCIEEDVAECSNFSAPKNSSRKQNDHTQFHEPSSTRKFRASVRPETKPQVDFFVDINFLARTCRFFKDAMANNNKEEDFLIIADVSPVEFHMFLEAVCPTIFGLRPVPITALNVVHQINMSRRFQCESLLTSCERTLHGMHNSEFNGRLLMRLIDAGMRACIDHKILCRILLLCITNTSRLATVSHDANGPVGAFLAQAFIANASKHFRHVRPLKEDRRPHPMIERLLQDTRGRKRKTSSCDHENKSFKCILCFQKTCKACKADESFCFKALDNFVYEAREQLWPETYQLYLNRDIVRERNIDFFFINHRILPPLARL